MPSLNPVDSPSCKGDSGSRSSAGKKHMSTGSDSDFALSPSKFGGNPSRAGSSYKKPKNDHSVTMSRATSSLRDDGRSVYQVDKLLAYLNKQKDLSTHEETGDSIASSHGRGTPNASATMGSSARDSLISTTLPPMTTGEAVSSIFAGLPHETAEPQMSMERDLHPFPAPPNLTMNVQTSAPIMTTSGGPELSLNTQITGTNQGIGMMAMVPPPSLERIPNIDGVEVDNNPHVQRLRQELSQANSTIARHEQELFQSRHIQRTMEEAMGTSEADFSITSDNPEPPPMTNMRTVNVARQSAGPQDSWAFASRDGAAGVPSDAARSTIWNPSARAFNVGPNSTQFAQQETPSTGAPAPFFGPIGQPLPASIREMVNPRNPQRAMSGPPSQFGFDSRYPQEPMPSPVSQAHGQRFGPMAVEDWSHTFGGYHMGAPSTAYGWAGRQAASQLSPYAPEFTSRTVSTGSVWSGTAPPSPTRSFVSTIEPPNYRRLLDRSVSCNWGYFVDKIIHTNDQQASIFLQQKLKTGSAEQKFEVIESIIHKAYHLMVNRFGNFLIQRCFEHGTPEQIIAIAETIRGNTLALSMDAFGCHVVQKAFDSVPENYKALFVHELLRRIPETVIHRYACHVWQKLFELRWKDTPPQIMKHVNGALRGMWHEVALGETGSLVVQNIFENCLEEEKRPAIEEVLASIDIIAHGQFGNWCIQHICEHGSPKDQTRAIEHILHYATEYSMDQFASKVVEKCLKIGGNEFLDRYLDRVCTGRADRPRMPLIDIASDQYGNYLIQYILTHSSAHHREVVATHIRKHMVSLRGSKFGSRVAMLCSNPSHTTRPGPGAGIPPLQRFAGNNRYVGPY